MKRLIKRITALILIGVIASCSTFKHPCYTVGRVTFFSGGVTTAPLPQLEYFVKGKKYTTDVGVNGTVIGERFKVKYDSLVPGKSRALKDQPLFLPGESYKKVVGTITDVWRIGVAYSYSPNPHEKPLRKLQLIKADSLKKHPEIKVGKKYFVNYWTYNPQRAVIYLDKPVDE